MLNPKEESVIELIAEDSVYENYFFNKVSNIKWFFPLKEKGYFSPDEAPGPKEADQKGYYRIPEWNVLFYLEKVSKQVDKPENQQYIGELLEIIKSVSNYRDTEGKPIDNYRTWWYFVKILLNIPNDKITQEIIDLIPIWLESRFDISLPGSEIGTKLLPQFLDSNNSEDLEKAEKIINFISAIKWVPKYTGEYKKKLLEKYKPILDKPKKERTEEEKIKISLINLEEIEPKTILDTYWLSESLRKNADKIAEKCSEKVIFNLADNLKQVFKKKLGPAHPTIEFGGNKYQMSIEQSEDFEYFVRVVLEKEVLEKQLPWESETTFELKDCRDKKTFTEEIKQRLLQRSDFKDLKDELDEELAKIYELIPQDASFIWFRNLFSEPEIGIHDTDEVLTAILRDIVLAKTKKDKKLAEEKLFPEFLGPKYRYPIFRRIALFVIGSEWDSFNSLFWKYINTDDGEVLFSRDVFEPELYTLLETNINKFNQKEKEKIKRIIDKGPQKEHYTDKQRNYWKQKWYSAVKADDYFKPFYEKQKEITEVKKEEISFKEPESWINISGPEYSSLSKEEMISMPNKKLADYLINFRTPGHWRGPNVESLSLVLKSAVQEKPEKFIENLNPFLNVPYFHIHHILWGIIGAWANKKFFDLGKLFEFIKQYIDRDDFWQDKFKIEDDRWNADHRWVIGIIGELIQKGTKDDAWAFPEEYFKPAKDILFLILDNLKPKEIKETRDAVNYALNSPSGKVIIALIYLALRIARVEAKKGIQKKIKWTSDIKEIYEKALQNKIIEAYILLGQYMTKLSYLDKEWVKEKINSISYSQDKDLWEAFMEGYLWAGKVHEYELMRKHFFAAVDYEFKEKHIEGRLVQYICVGYLGGNESLDENTLFGKLLKKWKASQIEEIIKFFWRHYEYLITGDSRKTKQIPTVQEKDKIIKRIIDFWRWVYKNHYENPKEITGDDKIILSDLCLLTVFLSKIDSANFEWLKLSACYVNTRFNSRFFIEYLDRLKDDKCYVGEILLEMLNNFIPPYPDLEAHVKSIVEYLYKTKIDKCKANADKICNIFGENGYDFLRSLYNNPSV
ncbi:hypothetical protein KAW65_07780 [candidate division WOR-3 bacterium]|nr:hypothetical protein [candidate division WOR-3 bacterium]